jgi:hypothetical protein
MHFLPENTQALEREYASTDRKFHMLVTDTVPYLEVPDYFLTLVSILAVYNLAFGNGNQNY